MQRSLPLFRKPILLGFIFSLPLVIGAIMSISFDLTTAFQRSGAIVVALVGFAAYLNYQVVKKNEELTSSNSKKIGENVRKNPQAAYDLINQQHPDLPEKQKMYMLTTALNITKAVENTNKELNELSSSIINTEAVFGIVGTLVWAFGDLFFV